MSVSKWAWRPECDNHVCCGDCDECAYADEVKFVITPACALWLTVKDWGLTADWNAKIYEAAFNDLMDILCKSGYLEKGNEDEQAN